MNINIQGSRISNVIEKLPKITKKKNDRELKKMQPLRARVGGCGPGSVRVRGFGPEKVPGFPDFRPDKGQGSRIWPRKKPGFEDLALKKPGCEDLAPKRARVQGFGFKIAPGSIFGAL